MGKSLSWRGWWGGLASCKRAHENKSSALSSLQN